MSKSPIEFLPKNPFEALRQLCFEWEKNPRPIDQIPKEFIDKFGIPALANSLKIKFPKLPTINYDEIEQHIDKFKINTIQNIVDCISQLPTDFEKLYAVYAYTAKNIQYDCVANRTKDCTQQDLETVFRRKKAECGGFTEFFIEIAKLVNIKSIQLFKFINMTKGADFNVITLNGLETHVCPIGVIDGFLYAIEPAGGSGNVTDNYGSFIPNYDRSFFLRPLICSLALYHPNDNIESLLGFNLDFNLYLKTASSFSFFKHDFKLETHPWQHCDSHNGLLSMQISALNPPNFFFNMILAEGKNEIKFDANLFIAVEILQFEIPNNPNHFRAMIHMAFPLSGTYKITIYKDQKHCHDVVVKNKDSFSTMPFQGSLMNDSLFIPLYPSHRFQKVTSGYGMIKFAANKLKNNLFLKAKKFKNKKFQESEEIEVNFSYTKVIIPFDDSRYEYVVTIKFPQKGIYQIDIWKGDSNWDYLTHYLYDVSGTEKNYDISPFLFISMERFFPPLEHNQISVEPNDSSIITNHQTFSVTVSYPKGINFVICIGDKDKNYTFGKNIDKKESNGKLICEHEFSFGQEGFYILYFCIDGKSVLEQQYFFTSRPPVEITKDSDLFEKIKAINSRQFNRPLK